jgi:hypothetical protein
LNQQTVSGDALREIVCTTRGCDAWRVARGQSGEAEESIAYLKAFEKVQNAWTWAATRGYYGSFSA